MIHGVCENLVHRSFSVIHLMIIPHLFSKHIFFFADLVDQNGDFSVMFGIYNVLIPFFRSKIVTLVLLSIEIWHVVFGQ